MYAPYSSNSFLSFFYIIDLAIICLSHAFRANLSQKAVTINHGLMLLIAKYIADVTDKLKGFVLVWISPGYRFVPSLFTEDNSLQSRLNLHSS